ncbi:EF-hand domain-containing family member C2-like isoform X2 [Atheta coriaria]
MVEKVKPNMLGVLSDRYPSVYARGEVIELPAWIAFDKQILTFDGFFQQSLEEVRNAPYAVRNVRVFFHLEDGTLQIIEKPQTNSGFLQGTLLSRQRVRLPAPMDDNFYDILDFNIGREIEVFGKFIKLTNCDKFTRNFLNRQGISVPDPINTPADPFLVDRAKTAATSLARKPNKTVDTFGQFLKNDRKLLRFYAYWDDRESEFGVFHDLEVFYYLADDTIEIKDVVSRGALKRSTGTLLMRRCKLPKRFTGLPNPGYNQANIVLNVLGGSVGTGRYVNDPLDAGKEHVEYYKDKDLSIGGILNVFGRNVVLVDADENTKKYYRDTYGVTSFVPINKPFEQSAENKKLIRVKDRELPPWNGFGSYEDSAQNCVTVEMVAPLKDFKKFLKYDRKGMDSQILRFAARMISRDQHNCDRKFIILYFQSDDTLQVTEIPFGKLTAVTFFARAPVFLPGQDPYTSEKPLVYTPQHLFIGAQVVINSFYFVLIAADEYALRYMEINCKNFPKSDIDLIMNKLRDKLKPIYKDFVSDMIPSDDTKAITYEQLRNKLCPIMGMDFTEQEMVTIARRFSLSCQKERLNKDAIRAITLTTLKRELWDDLARLREYFILRDPGRTGLLSRSTVYTLLRGCRFPVDIQLLEKILDVIDKDKNGNIIYQALFNFLDRNLCPMTDTIPLNVKSELWWASVREPPAGDLIDWCEFNKQLDLEYVFTDKPKFTNLVVPDDPIHI